ncbi:MAG: hypothetical protein V4621_01755 [Pseudomonadota bacterium]
MTHHTWIIGAGKGMGQSYGQVFPNPVFLSRTAPPPFNMDVTDINPEQLNALIAQYPPGILIYNAFVPRRATPSSVMADDLVYDFKVHVVGLVQVIQACEVALQGASKPAVIITGGGFAHDPHPALFSLGLGKAVQLNAAKSLMKHWQGTNIRVCYVTVNGPINKATGIDPDAIAQAALDWYDTDQTQLEIAVT